MKAPPRSPAGAPPGAAAGGRGGLPAVKAAAAPAAAGDGEGRTLDQAVELAQARKSNAVHLLRDKLLKEQTEDTYRKLAQTVRELMRAGES